MIHAFRYVLTVAIVLSCVVAVSPALAGASSQQATIAGFVGTWNCTTHGSDNKTYHETDADAMYGNWLRIDASYPAQNGQPASTSVTFFGYDAKHTRWIVTGVGTDGSYFTSVSMSPTFNGSKWTNQYPADHGTAVIHMTQATQYSMDTQGPSPQGKMMTQHAVCVKQ
jgi:hypothetical protein